MAQDSCKVRKSNLDVRCNGRNNVGGVWDKSGLRQGIKDETIKLPEKGLLSENHYNLPYFFLGDDSLL